MLVNSGSDRFIQIRALTSCGNKTSNQEDGCPQNDVKNGRIILAISLG